MIARGTQILREDRLCDHIHGAVMESHPRCALVLGVAPGVLAAPRRRLTSIEAAGA